MTEEKKVENTTTEVKQEEDIVTAFEIEAKDDSGIDYNKLLDKYGCFAMTPEIIKRIEDLSGKPAHRFIRRGIFFCERDLKVILDTYEKKQPFYLYTGRGPSADALHMGHTIPFIFTKYLQDAFDVPLVIQITDDEKYIYRPELELDGPKGTIQMGLNNIKDIIAFGFDPAKTFIFSDVAYIQHLYPNIIRVQKHVNYNQIKGIFGFNESDAVGKFAFPAVQAVPSFSNSFPHIFGKRKNVPCLIPAAIDQDPYFRMTRDVAQKLKYSKPASIYSTFFPALQGKKTKMSSSVDSSCILLTDTESTIKKKINKYALSGGGQTVEEHRANGANLDIDVPFQYLQFFLEDDAKLAEIKEKYSSGEMLTGEVKAVLIAELQKFVKEFQARRKIVTNKDVDEFMAVRKIEAMPRKWVPAASAKPAEGAKDAKKSTGGLKLYTAPNSHSSAFLSLIAADFANTHVTHVVATDKTQVKELKAKAHGADFPLLELEDGQIVGDIFAIAAHLLRSSQKGASILGASAFQRGQVNQFVSIAASKIAIESQVLESAVFGPKKHDDEQVAQITAGLKDAARKLDQALTGKDWLVGNALSFADLAVFVTLIPSFQLLLDEDFREETPALSEWFTKVAQLPLVARRVGIVQPCAVPVQPKK